MSDREQADKLLAVDQYGEDQWHSGWRWDDAHRPDDVPRALAVLATDVLTQQGEVQP